MMAGRLTAKLLTIEMALSVGAALLAAAHMTVAAAEPLHDCTRSIEAPYFPLKVSSTGRYLEDAAGTPFPMIGDSAWSLIAGLTREDAEIYLQDRRCRGFNTLLISLIEYRFVSDPPRNAYGVAPFTTPGDFTTVNASYFDHAEWIVGRAEQLGFLVLLTPAYLGFSGAGEGWADIVSTNGAENMRRYGDIIGKRLDEVASGHAEAE